MQKCNTTKRNIEVNRKQSSDSFRGLVTFPPRRDGWLFSLYLDSINKCNKKMYEQKK